MIYRWYSYSFLLLFSLASCGGGGGGGSSEAGINVSFEAAPMRSNATANSIAGEKSFVNTDGVQITLSKAYLTLWSVTLETDCSNVSFALLNPLSWLLPAAYAHAEKAPNRLSTPNIVNLLAADDISIPMGSAGPAPGNYCGVIVEMQAADEDSQGLPADVNMLGRSVYLEGTYLLPGSSEAQPFTVDTGRALREAMVRYPLAVSLSADNRSYTTRLNIVYDRWFDAVDFGNLSEQTQQDWVLNQITNSVKVL